MILAERLADAALTRAEGIDHEDKEAEFRQTDAARLHHGVLLCAAPVPVNTEDGREFAGSVGDVGVGGHPDIGAGLENELLDAIALALQFTEFLGIERAGFGGKATPRFEQVGAQFGALAVPITERGGRGIGTAKFRGAGFDKLQERLGRCVGRGSRCGRGLGGHEGK